MNETLLKKNNKTTSYFILSEKEAPFSKNCILKLDGLLQFRRYNAKIVFNMSKMCKN